MKNIKTSKSLSIISSLVVAFALILLPGIKDNAYAATSSAQAVKVKSGVTKKNTSLKVAPKSKSKVIMKIKKGKSVTVIKTYKTWYKVKLSSGKIGYVLKKDLITSSLTVKESTKLLNDTKQELKKFTDEKANTEKNLSTFDDLDFKVFSNQEWTRLHESHSKDIIVHWPDGHYTTGIEQHIKDLDAMFVYAPDTKITEHPIKIGSGDYTAVTGVMTGTFTKPMPIGNGQFIQPTGKKFSITMATFGHWKNGVMDEEWLFWDNATYMNQLGIGQ